MWRRSFLTENFLDNHDLRHILAKQCQNIYTANPSPAPKIQHVRGMNNKAPGKCCQLRLAEDEVENGLKLQRSLPGGRGHKPLAVLGKQLGFSGKETKHFPTMGIIRIK